MRRRCRGESRSRKDRNRNEEGEPLVWEFVAFVPWYVEPRILLVTGGGLLVAVVLTWLAAECAMR